MSALISTEALADRLGSPGLVVLDATWTFPGVTPDAAALHRVARIPGSRRFDIDAIADRSRPLPHMLPSPVHFAAAVSMLGIGNDTEIVTYDATGLTSAAARVWWMFRVFGHERVKVLDGGLPRWQAEGRPVESGEPAPIPAPTAFRAAFRSALVRDIEQVRQMSEAGRGRILDARSAGRFEGTEREPWAGGRGGHIPGSRSLPFAELVDPETKKLLPADTLRQRIGTLADGPELVASCGSGVTACVIALALAEIGRDDVAVYDGSWAEWGSHPELPAISGPE